MKITPLDIKKQRFRTKVRGYDPDEVETFLEMISLEFETVLNDKNRLADDVLKLKTQLKDYQQVEKTLQDTLVNAQENVSQKLENTRRESQILVREAELKAEKILDEAREKLDRMKNEAFIIRSQKESFAKRLRHLLESQIELIKVLEIDDSPIRGEEHLLMRRNQEKGEGDKSSVTPTESAAGGKSKNERTNGRQ